MSAGTTDNQAIGDSAVSAGYSRDRIAVDSGIGGYGK